MKMPEVDARRTPDAWGRVTSPVEPVDVRPPVSRRGEAWILVLVRGLLFLGGFCYALIVAFYLGYSAAAPIGFFWAERALAPITLVFWFLASFTDAGDKWTLAYLAVCVVEGVMLSIVFVVFW